MTGHTPSQQMVATLLPCPFCACESISQWTGFGTQADIVCDDCGCERSAQVRDVPGCKDAEWDEATYQFDGATIIMVNRYLALEWNERAPASGDVRAAVIEDLISTFEQMRGYPEGDSNDPCFDLCGMPCCDEFGCLHQKTREARAALSQSPATDAAGGRS